MAGRGVFISSTGAGTLSVDFNGTNALHTTSHAIETNDSGTANQLNLDLAATGITLENQTDGEFAAEFTGSGLNSTIVTALGPVTVTGNGTSGNDRGGILFNRITFDADTTDAIFNDDQVVGTGTLQIGQSTGQRVEGDGLSFLNPSGDLSINTLNIFNDSGTGLEVDTKGLATTFNLAGGGSGTIDSTNGGAMFLDPLTGNLVFGSVTSADATSLGASGLQASGNGIGIFVDGLSATDGAGENALTIDTLDVSDSADDGLQIINSDNATMTFGSTGGTTITDAGGDGIQIGQAGDMQTVVTNFQNTTMVDIGTGSGASGINIEGSNGQVTFGATDIDDVKDGQTGIDFTGSSTDSAFGVTTINSAAGSTGTGIDLSSTTGGAATVITFATTSEIDFANSGAGSVGVQLSSSDAVGTTANANFTFGDGALAAASTINVNAAGHTVDTIGLNDAAGTYNFLDVNFTGTADIATSNDIFVDNDTGVSGDGSFANPFSVQAALAEANTGQNFFFLDGTYDLNTINSGTTFTLKTGQSAEGFDGGNTATASGAPSNVSGLGAAGGSKSRGDAGTGTGSAISITNASGGSIFTLSGGNFVNNLTFDGTGSGDVILANGLATATTLQDLTIGIVTAGNAGVEFTGSTAAAGSLVMNNVSITGVAANGFGVFLDNNVGTVGLNNVDVNGTSAGTALSIDSGSASTGSISADANTSLGTTGTVVSIGAGARNVDFSAVNINTSGNTSDVVQIDGQTGGTISFGNITANATAGVVVDISSAEAQSGGTTEFGNVNSTGSFGDAVIRKTLESGSGTHTFGTVTVDSFGNSATDTVIDTDSANNAASSWTFNQLDITSAQGTGASFGAAQLAITTGTSQIQANNGNALNFSGTQFDAAGVTFNSVTSKNSSTHGITITNTSGPGKLTVNDVDIDNATSDGINIQNSASSNLFKSIDIATAGNDGIELIGNTGANTFNISSITGFQRDAVRGQNNSGSVTVTDEDGSNGTRTGGVINGSGGGDTAVQLFELAKQGTLLIDISDLTISNLAFTGISIDTHGSSFGTTASPVTVTNNSVATNGATGIFGISRDTGADDGDLVISISDNTVLANNAGVLLSAADGSSITAAVDDNTVTVLSASGTVRKGGIILDGDGTADGNDGAGILTVTSLSGNSIVDVAGTGGGGGTNALDFVGGIGVFNATFDADTTNGGTIDQVAGGNTTVGSLTNRVGGDGISFNNVAGNIGFGSLSIFNDNGTGLFVRDAGGKTGTFTISNTAGTVNTTNGTAMDIDPVQSNMTYSSVTSTNANGQGSSSNTAGGLFFDTVSAAGGAGTNALTITNTTVSDSSGSGITVNNSAGNYTFTTVAIEDSAGDGVSIADNAGTIAINGGTIDTGSTGDHGVHITAGAATTSGTVTVDDVDILIENNGSFAGVFADIAGSQTVNVTNGNINFDENNVTTTTDGIFALARNGSGTLTLNATGNTIVNDIANNGGRAVRVIAEDANNVVMDLSNNNLTGHRVEGVLIDNNSSGSVTITGFANNTLTRAGQGAGTAGDGGIVIDGATFDATPGGAIQQVVGGTLTIGNSGDTTQIEGDGLRLNNVAGNLTFSNLQIFNDTGTGLFVRDAAAKGSNSFAMSTTTGTINTTNGTAMDIDPVLVNYNFASVSSTNANGQGSSATSAGGLFFDAADAVGGAANNAVTINQLSITSSTGDGINIDNSTGTFTFNNTTIDNDGGTAGGGIDIDNGSGDTTTVNFTGTLDVDTTTGTGLNINGTAGTSLTVDIAAAGATSIDTTSGSGIIADTATLTGTLDTLNTTALAGNNGIDLKKINGGTFNVSGGTLTNTGAGIAIEIGGSTVGDGGNTNLTIATNINSSGATGRAIDIRERSGGSFTFSGNLTDNGAIGGGILVAGNNDGGSPTFTFSGTTKQVNTGTNTGVDVGTNTGATINFTNGGLDIDTTTGKGFSATGGGTVTVQGTSNTVNSGAARAVEIDNTSIGAAGVTFQSVSSNGADFGIVVENTGTAGTFSVTGDATTNQGGNGSGGTVQNSTSDGVFLQSAHASLNNMNIINHASNAVIGSGMHSLNLSNSTASSTGHDRTIQVGVGATVNPVAVTIDNNLVTAGSSDGIYVFQNNGIPGTANVTISNNMINAANPGSSAGDGIGIDQADNGTINVLIDNNTIGGFGRAQVNLLGRLGAGLLNGTVTNNTATSGSAGAFPGLRVIGLNTGGNADTVCADIRGNNFIGTGGFTDISLEQSGATTVNIESHANTAAVSAANNGDTVFPSGTINFGGPNCPTP